MHIVDYAEYIGLLSCVVISVFFLFFYLFLILFNLKVLIPGFLLKNYYLIYFSILLVMIAFVTTVQVNASYFIETGYQIRHRQFDSSGEYMLYLVVLFFMNAFFFAGISVTVFLQYRIVNTRKIEELEKECLRTELQELKNKIQPDFLLDMLNKASVSAVRDSTLTSEILFGLSHILRYQLYDSAKDKVLLTSDIAFINDYLTLEKMRLENFNFEIKKEGDLRGILFPGLLFMPFITAVLEYFQTYEPSTPSYIHLLYCRKERGVYFICRVSRQKGFPGFNMKSDRLYRRLKWVYGDECGWKTRESESEYQLEIKIPLV